MFNKKFWRPTLLYIILIELVSFGVFLLPELRIFSFVLISSIFLIVSLIDLKYGILIMLVELIIGSKGGYLFSLEMNGHVFSIRIAFYLILLFVWLVKVFLPALVRGKIKETFIIKSAWFKYFGVLMFFVLWGLLNGFLNHNSFSNIFFDFNAYLYFLLILPLFSILIKNDSKQIKEIFKEIIQVSLVAVFWISAKTLILLFLFSHKLNYINSYIYSWIRTSGVGEITKMQGGFYRIFFQSHIFVLVVFIAFFVVAIKNINRRWTTLGKILKQREFVVSILLLIMLSMTALVSMSRTNWLGFLVALFLIFIYSLWRYKLKGFVSFLLLSLFLLVFSFGLIVALVKFPYPKAIGGFQTSNLLTKRAGKITNEAGVSSRWNLLPKLSKEIKSSIFLGKGFGSTVTYISNDPRVRNNNKNGIYTTFAFEWGWLDIFLKLGFFGFLSYLVFLLVLIVCISKRAIKKKNKEEVFIILAITLIALSIINFFSPYLNHPLGIGLILFIVFLFEVLDKKDMVLLSDDEK